MSRKLVIALLALLLAVVTAWADPGGEGGCVNLPGGRSGSRPSSGGGGSFTATIVEMDGALFALPAEMYGAAVLVRGVDLPFAFLMPTAGGMLRVPAAMLTAMRGAGETGFTLDFVNERGEWLPVQVRLDPGQQLHITVP